MFFWIVHIVTPFPAMPKTIIPILIIVLYLLIAELSCEDYCYSETCKDTDTRYLFYDINPPEGFNLRRDVYMRFAVLARKLSLSKNPKLNVFKLVLPPWSHLFHWQYSREPEFIPWSLYFDVDSMKTFAPVIEMSDFLSSVNQNYGKIKLDEVYILQHFKDMFVTGNFEERMQIEECEVYRAPTYFYFENIASDNVQCLSFHGSAINLLGLLETSSAYTILIDHAEVALHHRFGNKQYWMARRSMRFNKDLKNIAASFRAEFLNSTDVLDNTVLPENWIDEEPSRNALGGPYLAVHMRRRDFARSRPDQAPSLENVAAQIQELLEKLSLKIVFIATDGSDKEYAYLKSLVNKGKMLKYVPSEDIIEKYNDGGIAIIDQIICSHGRYFVGTQESTFSMRIQEEREILGFPVESTFNSLCKSAEKCEKPSIWKIVY